MSKAGPKPSLLWKFTLMKSVNDLKLERKDISSAKREEQVGAKVDLLAICLCWCEVVRIKITPCFFCCSVQNDRSCGSGVFFKKRECNLIPQYLLE